MSSKIISILKPIPIMSVENSNFYFKNIEKYIDKYTYCNIEGLFKQTLKKKRHFECYFRTMETPKRLMKRYIIYIYPCKNINIDDMNNNGPFWSIKIDENKNKVVFDNNELLYFFKILIHTKNIRLRSICLLNKQNLETIYESSYESFSSLNPYIITSSIIKIQYFFRKFLKKKQIIINKYKLCMNELLYLPPGCVYGNIESFLGGTGFLNSKYNFNLSSHFS